MKSKKKEIITASVLIFALNVSVADDYFYIVKANDVLSSILYSKKICPIYGKAGSLAETLKLNPLIKKSVGNKIFPGMRVLLPKSQGSEDCHIVYQSELVIAPVPKKTIPMNKVENVVVDRLPGDDFKQSFYWKIFPSLSWKNLSSRDENIYRSSQVNAISNTNYGLGGTYGMHFEESVDIYSSLSLELVRFAQESTINLLQKNFLASRFGIGATYLKRWSLEVAMSDEFFLTSPGLSNIEIKKTTLPEIRASYLKDFYQYRSANLAYSLSGTGILPRASSDVKSKWGYGAGGAVSAKLHNQTFKIGYDINFLKASGNSTNAQNVYWNYVWETL